MKRLCKYGLVWLALLNAANGETSLYGAAKRQDTSRFFKQRLAYPGILSHLQNKNYEEAIQFLEPLAKKGDKPSQLMLGAIYCEHHDFEKAVFWLENLAKEGDGNAQAILGGAYLDKGLADKDKTALEQAHQWLRLSLKQNCAFAQYLTGVMYYCGIIVPQDFLRAAVYYKKAAIQGFSRAQVGLGKMFLKGEGISSDEEQAFYWIDKSAQDGLTEGIYYLGLCYRYGLGTKKDLKQAKQWLSKAAEQGEERAIEALKNL